MENTFQPICIMIFDQTNKQVYYKYVGETYSGDTVVGNIVYDDGDYVYDPKYYIYTSAKINSIKGGWVDNNRMRRIEVRPDTIRPYTQVERIKEQLRKGNHVKLIRSYSKDSFDNSVCLITNEKEIPYELWFRKVDKTKGHAQS